MSQRIQVFVRKRPCLQREANKPQVVEVIEEQSSVRLLDPDVFSNTNNLNKESAVGVTLSSTGKTSQPRSHKETLFTFDGVFDEDVSTERIYSQVGQTHIDDVINGFNTTFFAYGATGAGKTYTMLGSSDSTQTSSSSSSQLSQSSLSQSISQQALQSRGMMSLMVSGLFESIKSKQATHDITVRLAYMEIYNEAIKDLLSLNTKGLQIREHTKSDTTIIHGLTEIEVNNDSQVSAILKVGSRNRSKDSTALNDSSSRSHAILQLTVECLERKSSSNGIEQQHQQNQQLVTSKLMMVDLAGSEKSWTNKSKASKLEGANINQSLLALGNCIQLLSQIHMTQSSVKDTFIPYRASKLTRILKDSLGGNCRTIMIANISGSILSYDDTYNTLKYASRAKNITVHVQQNITTQFNPQQQADYSAIIENLSRENENLRSMLQSNHNINNNGSFDGFNDNNSLSFAVSQNHKRMQTSAGHSNHISQANTSRNDNMSEEEKKAVAEIENNMNRHFEDEAMCLRIIAEASTKIERIKKSNIQLEMLSKLTNNNNNSSNPSFQPSSSSQQPQQGYLAYANQQSAEEAKQSLEEAQSKLKQLVQLRKGLLPFIIINGQPSSTKGSGISPLAGQLSLKSQQYLSNAFSMHEMKSNNLQLSSKITRESDDIDTLEKELTALSHQVELRESILNQQKTATTKPASMTTFQSIITSLPNIANSSASQHLLPAQEHHQQLSKSLMQEQQQAGYLSSSANSVMLPKQQRLVQQSSAWKNYYSPQSYGSYINNVSLGQNSSSNSIASTKHQQLKQPNFSKYTPSPHSRSRYVKYSPTQHFSSLKHSSHSRHASSSSLLQLNNEEPSIVSSYLSYQYTGPDDSNNNKKRKQKRKEYFQSPSIVESRIPGNNNNNNNNGSIVLNNNHQSIVQAMINDNNNSNNHITQRLRNQSAIQYDNYSFEPTEKTRRNIPGIIITTNREGERGTGIDGTVPINKKQTVSAANNSHLSSSTTAAASSSAILTNWINSNPNSTPSTNRILPSIILSRNIRSTYDVHQSPYVRSFNSPSLSSRKNKQSLQLISPNTRKAQLQKLNWNINKLKQSHDGNAVGKQNILSYGVVA